MIFARFPSNRWFFKEMVASEEFRGKATSELKQTRQWRRKRGNEIAANLGSKTKPLKVQHIARLTLSQTWSKTTLISELTGNDKKRDSNLVDKMSQHFCSMGEKLAKNIPVKSSLSEQYIKKKASPLFCVLFLWLKNTLGGIPCGCKI